MFGYEALMKTTTEPADIGTLRTVREVIRYAIAAPSLASKVFKTGNVRVASQISRTMVKEMLTSP